MNVRWLSMHSLVVGTSLIMAASCGAPQLSTGNPGLATQMRISPKAFPDVTTERLYEQSSLSASIKDFAISDRRSHAPVCHDSLPSAIGTSVGIGVNSAHTLYVPSLAGKIYTFAPNCGGQGPSLTDPNGAPRAVAFDNKKGIVYAPESQSDCVEVYEHGATSPTRTLCNAALKGACGVAVDRYGNVYVSSITYRDYDDAIVEFPHGRQKGAGALKITGFQDGPCGLAFDLNGNLLIVAFENVYVFAPPFNGPPARRIITGCCGGYGALDHSNRHFFVASSGTSVDVYSYPAGNYEYSIRVTGRKRQRGVSGIAVDPPSGS
ncbi:MAG: hypothetical protein WCB99_05400 [Candidatus Cybelea sp.]|jgi:DNA-binding beta-propeller fold protein YncE